MKIKEIIELIGAYEAVRVVDDECNEIANCYAINLTKEVSEKIIHSIYTTKGVINIMALDKVKRKCYNKRRNAE